MLELEPSYREVVQRALAQEGLLIEHVILNGVAACAYPPTPSGFAGVPGCFICWWHDLGRLFP